jgi:hypothetical protein
MPISVLLFAVPSILLNEAKKHFCFDFDWFGGFSLVEMSLGHGEKSLDPQ